MSEQWVWDVDQQLWFETTVPELEPKEGEVIVYTASITGIVLGSDTRVLAAGSYTIVPLSFLQATELTDQECPMCGAEMAAVTMHRAIRTATVGSP